MVVRVVVNLVQAVPVNLGELRIHVGMGPHIVGGHVLVRVVAVEVRLIDAVDGAVVIAGQIAVVVRTGILGIVPVQCRVAVAAKAEQGGEAAFELVRGSEAPLGQGHGLMRFAHAGVAHLAVLVTPVGVVHVVSYQVVHFLGGSHLGATFAGSGKECQAQFMDIGELLVRGQIVRQGTIVNAFGPVVSAQTGAHVGSESPAIVHHAGGIGSHHAQTVQRAVGEGAHAEAFTHLGGRTKNVGGAIVSAKAEVRHLCTVHTFLGTRGLVEAAPQGIGAVTGNGVVQFYAGQIHVLAFRAVTAGAETHGGEVVTGNAVEHVVAAEQDGGIVVVTAILQVQRGKVVFVGLVHPLYAGEGEVEHVLHIAVLHGHLHLVLQEIGGVNHQGVIAVRQAGDKEGSVLGRCHRGDVRRARLQDQAGVLHRDTAVAVHHRTLHTARRGLGEEGQGGKSSRKG